MSKKSTLTLLIILAFVFLLAVRLIHLAADPPYDLSASGAPYGDPGGYSFNARNKILFGTWEIDNYNMMYHNLPPHLVTYVIFKIFGIGIAQQNLVPVLFSFLALIFFFLILRKRFGDSLALLGTTLLGINYLFLMYSRVANRVAPSIFFILLAIYFLQKAEKKQGLLVAAGISFIMALISKSVVFYIIGAVLLGYLFYLLFKTNLGNTVKKYIFLLLGAVIILLPWVFFVYLPHKDFMQSFTELNVQYLIPPAKLDLVLRYFWSRPEILLQEMPIISVFAFIFSLVLLNKIIHKPGFILLPDWIFFSWFVIGSVYYAVIQQRVTRHYIPHIVPLIFLAISFIHDFFRGRNLQPYKKTRPVYLFFVFLWMLFPVSLLLKTTGKKFPKLIQGQQTLYLLLIILSFLMAAVVFYVFKAMNKKEKIPFSSSLKKGAVIVLVCASIFIQISQYLKWAINPPYQFKEISRDFGKAFDNAVFAGLWAPAITLENIHKAYEYFPGYINDDEEFFEKFSITHVFTTTAFREHINFRRNFPKIFEKANLLARYHIWIAEVLLYEVSPDKKSQQDNFLEAELFTCKGNTPRYDRKASRNFAVLSRKGESGFVVIATNNKKYSPGKYNVTFRIKKQTVRNNQEKSIIRLDVVSEDIHRLIEARQLSVENIKKEYGNYSLQVTVHKPMSLTFRVYTKENASFWIDWIKIDKMNYNK